MRGLRRRIGHLQRAWRRRGVPWSASQPHLPHVVHVDGGRALSAVLPPTIAVPRRLAAALSRSLAEPFAAAVLPRTAALTWTVAKALAIRQLALLASAFVEAGRCHARGISRAHRAEGTDGQRVLIHRRGNCSKWQVPAIPDGCALVGVVEQVELAKVGVSENLQRFGVRIRRPGTPETVKIGSRRLGSMALTTRKFRRS